MQQVLLTTLLTDFIIHQELFHTRPFVEGGVRTEEAHSGFSVQTGTSRILLFLVSISHGIHVYAKSCCVR